MNYIRSLVSTVPLLIVSSASAHHANFATYDLSKEITVEGVVTELKLVNPHAWIYLDVTDGAGDLKRWKIELAGKLSLSRRGWTDDSIAEGDRVTVVGNPSRRGTPAMWWQRLILADGTEFTDPFIEDGATIDEQRRQRLSGQSQER